MTHNVGGADKVLRIILGLVLAAIAFMGTVQGVWQIVAGIAAVIMLGTAFVGTCPLYSLLHVSTRAKKA